MSAINSGRPWAFTDIHAVPDYANYFDRVEHLVTIDWDVMDLRYWKDQRERRQAEFLVYEWFPWTGVEKIGVYDQRAAEEVLQIIDAFDHKPVVAVERSWYY